MTTATRAVMALAATALLTGVAARPHVPHTRPTKAGGPDVSFSASAITVTSATAGATVYLAGVSLYGGNYAVHAETPASAATVDSHGVATFAVEHGVPIRSVWIVVDGSTGGYTVAAPPGGVLREMDLPGAASPAANGLLRRMQLTHYSIDLFIIRPGSGIWSGRLVDGGASDNDGAMNGRIDADLGALAAVAGAQAGPFDKVSHGDVLFFVDRTGLEYAVAKQGK